MAGTAFRDRASSMGFRWLALATVAVTYALVVLGGVVRATDSGDACPDWPRCHGELLPPLEADVLIEFSHRLVASIVGLLVLALAVAAWRWRRDVPVIVWGATVAVGLVVAQIILGGMTVLNDLSSSLVTAHLALATTLLATLLVVALASLPAPQAEGRAQRESVVSFRNLALVAV
ncbi:MAG: COX15/CtaA family protein, partial [Dehalococcoidia bacterium]|nr:COX15/CtaA family protein [Dehalococcoidia bacterium]